MIPRHPGDPERLPKVSKRASGALSAGGPPPGWFRFGGGRCSGKGGLPDAPNPGPRPGQQVWEQPRPVPGAVQRWAKGGRRGRAVSSLAFHLCGPLFLKEEKKGFSDTRILDSARGT